MYHLRQIYRRHGVTMQKIKLGKVVEGPKLHDQHQKILDFVAKKKRLEAAGFTPIFVDEVMFTASTNL